jgi:hypothetical protein
LGIGTTSPSDFIEISAAANTTIFRTNTNTNLANGNIIGQWDIRGLNGSGAARQWAYIICEAVDVTSGSENSVLRFNTTNDGTISTDIIRLYNNQLGVTGNTNPSYPFHVALTKSDTALVYIDSTNNSITANGARDSGTGLVLRHTTSASSASNDLVERVMFADWTNNLTGGGAVTNARCLDFTTNTNASTTTTSLSHIYLNTGTTSGTVTTGYGIQIVAVQGTTKYGIYDSSAAQGYFAGNIGFGETNPTTLIYITAADNSTAQTIKINATQANVTTADTFLDFRSTTGSEGTVQGTGVAGVIAYNTFTGSHWSQSSAILAIPKMKTSTRLKPIKDGDPRNPKDYEKIIEDVTVYESDVVPGSVLVSLDDLCRWDGEGDSHLPRCKVSDTADDKAVYGVYGGHDRDGDIMVLAIGAGKVLVCDEGGGIEVGDFLSTSSVPGYAKKYNGNDMRVVLGKARQSFKGIKGEIACTYMCG